MRTIVRPLAELADQIALDVAVLIRDALLQQSSFNLVLTGGSLGIATAEALGRQEVDWSKVTIWFGDERFVGLDHPDRNEAQALKVWPDLATLNLIRYPDASKELQDAANKFDADFQARFGDINATSAVFDLVLVGMGPDGHIASLFPGHAQPRSWIVSESDSPKPPSERLSFSYEALNRSQRVWFLVSGASKAPALRSALVDSHLPASQVRGMGETVWYLDSEISDAL